MGTQLTGSALDLSLTRHPALISSSESPGYCRVSPGGCRESCCADQHMSDSLGNCLRTVELFLESPICPHGHRMPRAHAESHACRSDFKTHARSCVHFKQHMLVLGKPSRAGGKVVELHTCHTLMIPPLLSRRRTLTSFHVSQAGHAMTVTGHRSSDAASQSSLESEGAPRGDVRKALQRRGALSSAI